MSRWFGGRRRGVALSVVLAGCADIPTSGDPETVKARGRAGAVRAAGPGDRAGSAARGQPDLDRLRFPGGLRHHRGGLRDGPQVPDPGRRAAGPPEGHHHLRPGPVLPRRTRRRPGGAHARWRSAGWTTRACTSPSPASGPSRSRSSWPGWAATGGSRARRPGSWSPSRTSSASTARSTTTTSPGRRVPRCWCRTRCTPRAPRSRPPRGWSPCCAGLPAGSAGWR